MHFAVILKLTFLFFLCSCAHSDWRNADKSSIGIALLPQIEKAALVQVYTARTVRWRGYFSVHSWIATKEKNAETYSTYHVIGFRVKSTGSAVVVTDEEPDKRWYGATPTLIHEIKGELAESAIPKIKAAVEAYPYPAQYRA